jgi:hypothetical protein
MQQQQQHQHHNCNTVQFLSNKDVSKVALLSEIMA